MPVSFKYIHAIYEPSLDSWIIPDYLFVLEIIGSMVYYLTRWADATRRPEPPYIPPGEYARQDSQGN